MKFSQITVGLDSVHFENNHLSLCSLAPLPPARSLTILISCNPPITSTAVSPPAPPPARQNGLVFVPAIFSYAGEMHKRIKRHFLEQIRLKLQLVDDEVRKSKVRSIMKHSVCQISAAINRSASRNTLLKATKMVNLARHT